MATCRGPSWAIFLVVMVAVLPLALSTNSKYIVTAPAKARRGYLFTVKVILLVPSGATNVEASITDVSNQVQVQPVSANFVGTTANEQQLITLTINDNLSPGKHYLNVESKSGVVFKIKQDLEILSETGLILIQTDKQMYKESQTVHIRGAVLASDTKPLDTDLDVMIKDPKENILAHYRSLTPNLGVVTVDFELVNDPIFGEWTITVMGTTMPEIASERKFTVSKYVLPKYSVEATLPSFVRLFPGTTEKSMTIDVMAKYTYGKPVNGLAILQVTSGGRVKEMEKRLVNGMATFTSSVFRSDVVAYRYQGNPEAQVKVTVTEDVTDKQEMFEGSVPVVITPYKIDFINDDGSFVYGMPLNIFVKVTDIMGGSIPAADRSDLSVAVKFTLSKSWTLNEKLLPTLVLTMPAAGDVIATKVDIPTKDQMENQTFNMMGELSYPSANSDGDQKINTGSRYKYPVSTKTNLGISVDVVGITDQIQSPDKTVPAGQAVTFRVTTTVTEAVFYEVHAKGILLLNGILSPTETSPGLYTADFDVTVTSKMAPNAVVVVYANTATDEIIADSQTFSVSGLLRQQLNVRFDSDLKEVGDIAEMTVAADPNSVVFVSAIDKKAALLGKPNNIDLAQLLEGLDEFDLIADPKDDNTDWGCGGCGIMFKRKRRDVEIVRSSSGVTPSSILRDAGVMMMTDSTITDSAVNQPFPEMFPVGVAEMAPMDDAIQRKGDVAEATGTDLDSKATVRKNFPETWIWENINIGSSGVSTTNIPVPDTITSWVVNAFSMNKQTGMDLDPNPPALTVMKKMFTSLSLPYSVVRGEKFKLLIYVFNYFNNPLSVDVTLAASNDFGTFPLDSTKEILDDETNAQNVAVTKTGLQVLSNSSNGFFLWIYPRTLGTIKLRVTAISPKKTDIVEQTLLVEPEGKTAMGSNSIMITHEEVKTVEFTMEALPSPGAVVVDGSKETYVSVTGDVLGPTIENLDQLVRQPCGCGEQNMITLVPNIFVRKYLEAVKDVVDPSLVKLTNQYMESGYQRELNYKHDDWSYSAFGNSDKSGSTWLTSFVVKSFAMAKQFIPVTVNEDGISKSVAWLLTQLDEETYTFNEPGTVIHTDMKGGTSSSKFTLTAFIYITLKEAMSAMPLTVSNLDTKLAGVLSALENNYRNKRDAWVADKAYFRLSIMAYAFALGGSSETSDVLQKLEEIAQKKDGMMYWSKKVEPAFKNNGRLYCGVPSGPSDIETASYVILAYTKLNNLIDSRLVLKWLLSQLNGAGSFKSTQDTVVGLQAIAELSALIGSGVTGMNINIEYTSTGSTAQTLTVTDSNKFLLQKDKLPEDTTEVSFRITGKGQVLLRLYWKYNIIASPQNNDTNKFALKTVTEAINYNTFDTIIDFQLLDREESGGMALVTYTAPSGFSTDIDRITGVARKETNGKTVTLYINSLQMDQKQLRLQSFRTQDVAEMKSGFVTVGMYYNPDASKTVTYDLPETVKLTACQLSGDMDDECPKPRNPNGATSVTPTNLLLALISLLLLLTNLN